MRLDRTVAPAALVALVLAGACSSGADGAEDAPRRNAAGEPSGQEAARPAPTPAAPARPLPGRAWVIFGTDTVRAEVARTPDERARGLMHRDELPDGRGMLFVFESEGIRSFWMSNTYIPLDIAYMDASLRIVDIQQMEPLVTDTYDSAAPAMFALEVPQGWFAEHGIETGAVAEVVFGG